MSEYKEIPRPSFSRRKLKGKWVYYLNHESGGFCEIEPFIIPIGANVYNEVWHDGGIKYRSIFIVRSPFPVSEYRKSQPLMKDDGTLIPFTEEEYRRGFARTLASMKKVPV